MGMDTGALQINFTPHPITSSLRSIFTGAARGEMAFAACFGGNVLPRLSFRIHC